MPQILLAGSDSHVDGRGVIMDNYFIDDFKQKKERYYASLSLLKKSLESLDNAQNLYNRLTEEVEELKPEDEQPFKDYLNEVQELKAEAEKTFRTCAEEYISVLEILAATSGLIRVFDETKEDEEDAGQDQDG